VAEIHDRMPLILSAGDYNRWLNEEPDPLDLLRRDRESTSRRMMIRLLSSQSRRQVQRPRAVTGEFRGFGRRWTCVE
jgi:putative SOS response-associated peptidase YedK